MWNLKIDLCGKIKSVTSQDLIDKLKSVEVGEYDFWIKHSDHVPLIVNFDLN
ncbi:hypothetical protein AQPE_2341 [Aquipluma nitroreducens]|uniref:Uncharacterized protein n=1 Tax=Aquipluma nitroreducens TaxID=2010828 RepID=A0A5K7S9C7_9BACT|nr:hypothetical protein AQPE_2341 [Aquipluma nitroreducens]